MSRRSASTHPQTYPLPQVAVVPHYARTWYKFIKWHRSLDIATAVLVGGIVVLAVARSGLALAPLPLICVLMVMKAAVSLTQDYKNYRHGKVVSAEWLFSLIWHIAFVGGACFFIWVTTLLAIAVVSAS